MDSNNIKQTPSCARRRAPLERPGLPVSGQAVCAREQQLLPAPQVVHAVRGRPEGQQTLCHQPPRVVLGEALREPRKDAFSGHVTTPHSKQQWRQQGAPRQQVTGMPIEVIVARSRQASTACRYAALLHACSQTSGEGAQAPLHMGTRLCHSPPPAAACGKAKTQSPQAASAPLTPHQSPADRPHGSAQQLCGGRLIGSCARAERAFHHIAGVLAG